MPIFFQSIFTPLWNAYRLLPEEDGRQSTVIDGFRAQASAVSVGIRASLERTISERANLVIDGVSITPGSIHVDAYAGVADVIFLLVAVLDESVLRDRFTARAVGQKRRLAHRYLENFEGILEIERYLLDQARRHDVPIIDNVSFDASVRRVIEHVMQALRRREQHAG